MPSAMFSNLLNLTIAYNLGTRETCKKDGRQEDLRGWKRGREELRRIQCGGGKRFVNMGIIL